MTLPSVLSIEIARACTRLGDDAFEVRELLQSGDVALALEVLVDQYDALGLPLPGPLLEQYGWIVQLRSDLEELQELLEAEDEHRFDPALLAVIAELDEALLGDREGVRSAAELVHGLFVPGKLADFSLPDDEPGPGGTNSSLASLKQRIQDTAARLR